MTQVDNEVSKLVINLTNTELPSNVREIIGVGDKFNYLDSLDKRTAFHFYKNIEQFLIFNKPDKSHDLRNSLIS